MLWGLAGKELHMSINGTEEERRNYMGNNTTKVVTGVLGDAYNFKGSMNCDLTFKFNKYTGIIELYSSYGEWIGNAYSISSLIELLTKLRNDELA